MIEYGVAWNKIQIYNLKFKIYTFEFAIWKSWCTEFIV